MAKCSRPAVGQASPGETLDQSMDIVTLNGLYRAAEAEDFFSRYNHNSRVYLKGILAPC
jgi:hypothetical protein